MNNDYGTSDHDFDKHILPARRIHIHGENGGRRRTFLEETKVLAWFVATIASFSAAGTAGWYDIRSRTDDRWSGSSEVEAAVLRENLNEDIGYISLTPDQIRRIQARGHHRFD